MRLPIKSRMSVPQSLILQMPRFGMDVVLAHPPEFRLMPDIMDQAQEQARKFGTGFEVVDDMDEAFKDADIIYRQVVGSRWCFTSGPKTGHGDHQQI